MKYNLILLLTLITSAFLSENTFAQSNYEDVVYLKNGSIIHGMIIEQIPNESIKIQTKDKNLFVFKIDEILKITKEEVQSEPPPSSPPPSAPVKTPVYVEPVKKERKKSGYTNITELNGARSFSHTESMFEDPGFPYPYESHFDNINNGPSIGIQTVNGYLFNPYFSMGAGVGMQAYNELFLVPFFLDLRANFIDGNVSPFIAAEIGNSFTRYQLWGISTDYDDEGGFMGSVTGGVKFFPTPTMALNFSIGFRYQEIKVVNDAPNYNSSYLSQKSLNQFNLRMGFTF